jgi:hypothetical protein
MQNSKSDWPNICGLLNEELSKYSGSIVSLSIKAEIDYFSARRYLNQGAKNRCSSAEKLCDFFKIEHSLSAISAKSREEMYSALAGTIDEVWDGSPSHADLLIKLVRSTQPFSVRRSAKEPSGLVK